MVVFGRKWKIAVEMIKVIMTMIYNHVKNTKKLNLELYVIFAKLILMMKWYQWMKLYSWIFPKMQISIDYDKIHFYRWKNLFVMFMELFTLTMPTTQKFFYFYNFDSSNLPPCRITTVFFTDRMSQNFGEMLTGKINRRYYYQKIIVGPLRLITMISYGKYIF